MPGAQKRRRRSREEAEREILEAAAALLRERPLHEVSVSAIMEQTTLSRKSFYVYFRDRYELLTRLFRPLRRELDEHNALFLPTPTGDLWSRAALDAVTSFMAGRDGALVRALHEASTYDEEAARVWREFNEPVIATFTDRIRREVAAGRLPAGIDVEPTVRALVGMNLYCFFDRVVGNPGADRETIAATLHTIWTRTFLLSDPPPVRRETVAR
jgi:TetR/AcrR family transcriptional regulator, ethionamide resistance regulator